MVGLLFEGGLNTNALTFELRKIWIIGARQRNITCGSANLDTELFGTYNESVGTKIVNAIITLTSVPFFSFSKHLNDMLGDDGGGIIGLDVLSRV